MMNTLDCTDIQALLSALIDGEVEDGVRHQAERHLAECQRCRERINEAEALDELIQSGVASMIDPGGLPQGFENRVLSRTIYQQAHRPYLQQWTTWGGWAAAAAALALAITIWVSDRRVGVMPVHQSGLVSPGLSAGTGSQVKTAVYSTGSQHRSLTLDRTLGFDELRSPPDATDVLEQGADVEPDITVRQREDAETLYFTAVLLQMLHEASDPSPEDLDELRRAMEYDRLLPRLAELRPRLKPLDRLLVIAAESCFVRIAEGPLTEQDLRLIIRTVSELELSAALDSMSDRVDPNSI